MPTTFDVNNSMLHSAPHSLEAEQAVLGAILLDNSALSLVRDTITPKDFYRTGHQELFQTMLDMADGGHSIDNITLVETLTGNGKLVGIGGAGYLGELLTTVPSAVNIVSHARLVVEKSRIRTLRNHLINTMHKIEHGIEWNDLAPMVAQLKDLTHSIAPLNGEPLSTGLASALLEYAALVTLDLPTRKHYLSWLPEGANVMVYGPRGIGKTFFELSLTASLVTGTQFLKWPISEAAGVLYIDGEMQLDELRGRMTNLLPEPPKAPLHFLSSEMVYHQLKRDLILSSVEVRDEVIGILDAHPKIRVLIFDNISCLFAGLDEDKKRDWEPIAAWFIRLRHRGLSTVLVHHAGKGGQQRGTSGREDALDTVIALSRPSTHEAKEGCHFEVKFEKCRSVKGKDVCPLDVTLTDMGKPLTWTYKDLELSKEDEVRALLADGLTSNAEIAEALGITRAYVWKLRKKIEKGGGQ
ncbi:MAG: AAA family ATPase [Nitrospira sp.]|nr:AAA family ATPase [Nitrospira sp.]